MKTRITYEVHVFIGCSKVVLPFYYSGEAGRVCRQLASAGFEPVLLRATERTSKEQVDFEGRAF